MDDLQVYQEIDNILSENLSIKSLGDLHKIFLATIESNYTDDIDYRGKHIIKEYLKKTGFIFMSEKENGGLDFLYKGKVWTFEIYTSINELIEYDISKNNNLTSNFFVAFFPRTGEIFRTKTNDLRSFIDINKKDTSVITQKENSSTYIMDKSNKKIKEIFSIIDINNV